jgi:predicted TIM-barrel fold metal-dependent hydrolase
MVAQARARPRVIRETIAAMERMGATPEERAKIYEGNARRILRLWGH